MPFRLCQNRRVGHYELSRDMYVVSVQLLDGNVLQCSLASESSGQVCLDYVCLRLNLGQSVFFGLRCRTSKIQFRWIELDKPLRKQFDKSEQNHLRLYFGVIFHAPSVATLTDEVTRYHFYLQMQADILEGRLLVSPQKAIMLASYSLQVDLGDFNDSRHTLQVFRDWMLLPKHLTQSAQILEDLIGQVIQGYRSLRGLTQRQAELLYISEAQQCEGYGEEYFPGKDEDGNDVFVGYYSEGIILKRLQGPPLKYRWEEVRAIHSNKRNFTVDCVELSNLCFQMEDVETAKYAAFLFSLQWKFFSCLSASERKVDPITEMDLSPFSRTVAIAPRHRTMNEAKQFNLAASTGSVGHLSYWKRSDDQTDRKAFSSVNLCVTANSTKGTTVQSCTSTSSTSGMCSDAGCNTYYHTVADSRRSVADMGEIQLPSYRSAPDYETALSQPSLDEYSLAVWRELQNNQQRHGYMTKASTSMSSQSLVGHGRRILDNIHSVNAELLSGRVNKAAATGRPMQYSYTSHQQLFGVRDSPVSCSSPDVSSAWWPPTGSTNNCNAHRVSLGCDLLTSAAASFVPSSPLCIRHRSHQQIANPLGVAAANAHP